MTIQKYRYVPCNPNTNKHCVFAWVNGMSYKRGSNYRKQGLTTDGVDIYSYGLQIGRTGAFNKKILYDYTAKEGSWLVFPNHRLPRQLSEALRGHNCV